MIQKQAQQGLEATADNVVPFPATNATGNEEALKLYTADELKQSFAPTAQTTRTVRDLVAKVREAYYWMDELDFKRGDKFTLFCFEQIRAMKDSGLTHRQWIAETQKKVPQQQHQQEPTPQPIEAELVEESLAPMIHVPEVHGLSRLDLARKKQADVQNRLTHTLEEFKTWDEALNAEITANKEATAIEGQADFDEKVIDLLLRKKEEQDRLKKLEALIDSGAISADELLKRYVAPSPKAPMGNESNASS